ncbi:type II toxin-antitoxin system Phd/YefM family antitoxin [Nocardia cyriacigeorgica]|uniref:type II toxin-antitoxin system Phd/YefM family antitoxin n=1 Tax=Nocardia cyriacigeorgica TaxID=135487 RepID=UPI0018958C66|nr:type II toxin-antitoxin system prevent-host-death family antitoxin [Nocardia cyriacigeorgica]MBF6453567.1 type II toxin-antitoxin system prevent-host-death family antitoxin [Nocardia cyriacigeorgica]MBF6482467.1 type II toxin-antitoxin system prevent-host-death family antitoxin [Nocardia cyriacigeorgica]MBF6550735.1 type II toxin-antitoxin system prevent-host-death family antitoxin [Nocardia cyriacigeorgica]
MKAIDQLDFCEHTGRVLAAVEAGASITITRDGRPIAILAPVRQRTFVPISELAQTSTHLPRIDYAEWRATSMP